MRGVDFSLPHAESTSTVAASKLSAAEDRFSDMCMRSVSSGSSVLGGVGGSASVTVCVCVWVGSRLVALVIATPMSIRSARRVAQLTYDLGGLSR